MNKKIQKTVAIILVALAGHSDRNAFEYGYEA